MAGYILYSLDWDKFQQLVKQPTPGQLTTLGKLLYDGLDEMDGEFEEGDPVLEWPAKPKALAQIAFKRLPLPDWYGDLSSAGKSLWEGVVFRACMDNEDFDLGFRVDSDGVYWDVIELAWKQRGVVPHQVCESALSAFGTRPFRYHPRPGPGKSREEFDKEQGETRASLDALGKMLGQFLEDAKQGKKDPSQLLAELEGSQGVSNEHKDLIKGFLTEDDDDDEDGDEEDWTPMHSMHEPQEVQKMLEELTAMEAILKSADEEVRQQYEEELLPALQEVVKDGRMLFVQVDT